MISPSSLLTPVQLPVLLVFTPATLTQRAEVDQLVEKARSVLNPAVRIMRITEATHPEVVSSFEFTAQPSFVLLQRGLELWRHTGSIDGPELLQQLSARLGQSIFRNLTD
jgi:hypothetical protein